MTFQEKQAETRRKMISIFGPSCEVGSEAWKASKQQIIDDAIARRDIALIQRAERIKAAVSQYKPKQSAPEGRLD